MSAEQSLGHLGKYELLRELGRGAFGTVYLARETLLEVQRALKVLHPHLVHDETLRARFRREAQVAARLEHPHIVPVYEFGEVEGKFYLAMRYMAGGSLKARLKREGPLSWPEVRRITREITAGLGHAHQQGVVHRDLKPSNILFDQAGRAAIGDFGFAKVLRGRGAQLSLTGTGRLLGTPAYMAPEQWKGQAVGPAVDQYALACLVVEMLTGRVLFGGKTPWEVMEKHKEGPVFPTQWPEGVPAGIEAVLRKALAKEPDARFPDVRAFAEALTQVERAASGERPASPSRTPHAPRAAATHPPIRPTTVTNLTTLHQWKAAPAKVLAFTPDGTALASGGMDARVYLWRLPEGHLWLRLEGHTAPVTDLAFSPRGRWLASASWDGTVRLWRLPDGTLHRVLQGHTNGVNGVAFSPDGSLVVSGALDGTVRLWRMPDGVLLRAWTNPSQRISSVAFAPSENLFVVGTWDGTIHWWRAPEETPGRSLRAHAGAVRSLAFSPDGHLLASASEDRTIRLWRTVNGQSFGTLEGHRDWVNGVAFSTDGSVLASASEDHTIRLWQVTMGQSLRVLQDHSESVLGVAFAPEGDRLASASADGTIRLWGVVASSGGDTR